jgi:curved DNA-binding protein CbpA
MPERTLPDHYEVLQVSSRADHETIERVFRHLAHRYHPDNKESGDAERFVELVNAYTILANPEQRAKYDVGYESLRKERWRIFNQDSTNSEIANDARIRMALLSLLYAARRHNAREPGMGVLELERLLDCSSSMLEFQLWYLKENTWVERIESGHLAITARGVDKLFDLGGPPQRGPQLLQPGEKFTGTQGAA